MIAQPTLKPLLRFNNADDPDALRDEVSACCFDERGRLWCGTDERNGLSCLTPQPAAASGAATFGAHRQIDLAGALDLPDGKDEEIDIEGMDYGEGRIWFVGSHTSTRRGAEPDDLGRKQRKALRDVKRRLNRFMLGCFEPDGAAVRLAQLPIGKRGNKLSEALRDDDHLAPFLRSQDARPGWPQLAAKENGFDIEGLAVRGERLFLGLRGPVLRGWALLLEVAVDDGKAPKLKLEQIGRALGGKKRVYRKHFLALDGMGVRDLCWQGNDLLLLAGPTMDITGRQTLWRLRDAATLDDDSITRRGRHLEPLFDLPFEPDGDKAEGLAPWYPTSSAGAGNGHAGVMIVYDAPVPARKEGADGVRADVFGLPVGGDAGALS
ncbi:MAG: DUF3616 domain-containing protein [Thiohalocapsa sp.]|jgi:hypothetical protein|uniref:DUF3616 domain-containing protein n=1 Tax=Thiohalocapsa sp. TaxID=2497641 RepID=UPI0025CB7E4B|nr:DUF3616 domain-containing protein [Thiohalocapsa sp.]MCG6943521.1 DUF3616 domain-containing protein [Thiohalocapsa sp.]